MYTPVDANDAVPDPDGRPIAPAALAQAEERMIREVEQPARAVPETPHPDRASEPERVAAAAAVERQNSIDVPAPDADGYRLAPQENRLDWLQVLPRTVATERLQEQPQERTEDRLDWLKALPRPQHDQEREQHHEPDRYRR